MEKFPEIVKGVFAVLIADRDTGIVLKTDFSRVSSYNQQVYKVFGSLGEAEVYIARIMKAGTTWNMSSTITARM